MLGMAKGVSYLECIVLNIYGTLFQILALMGLRGTSNCTECLESKNCI